MRNSIGASACTRAGGRASCFDARDFLLAVAIANRLSALLTEDVAREARRARGPLSAPTTLPHSDLRGRNWHSPRADGSRQSSEPGGSTKRSGARGAVASPPVIREPSSLPPRVEDTGASGVPSC